MITVLDFYAKWCGPCQQIIKILPRLEKAIAGKGVVEKIDIDEHPELKQQYEVDKIPTFVLLKNGQEVYRFEGVIPILKIADKVHELA